MDAVPEAFGDALFLIFGVIRMARRSRISRRKTRRGRKGSRRKQKGGSLEFLQGSGISNVGSTGLQVSLGGVALQEQNLPLTDVQSEPQYTLTLEPNTF